MNTLEILVHTLEMFSNNVHILSTFRTFPRWRLAETYAWLLPIDAIHLIMETPENVFVACHIILPLLWHKYRLKTISEFLSQKNFRFRINYVLILMLVYRIWLLKLLKCARKEHLFFPDVMSCSLHGFTKKQIPNFH